MAYPDSRPQTPIHDLNLTIQSPRDTDRHQYQKAAFVRRCIFFMVILAMALLAIVILVSSGHLELTDPAKLPRWISIGSDSEVDIGRIAAALDLDKTQMSIEGDSTVLIDVDDAVYDRIMDLVDRGDPRLKWASISSIDGRTIADYSGDGGRCDGARSKCIRTDGNNGISIVNLPANASCVVRLDSGETVPTLVVAETTIMAIFNEPASSDPLPTVEIFSEFDQGRCQGRLISTMSCHNEMPCQICTEQCLDGSICEPATVGQGICRPYRWTTD